MIKIEKLTPFQKVIYPLILRSLAELIDNREKATYEKIVKQILEKEVAQVNGVDIQLSLFTLLNEAILNVENGVYHFNDLQEETIYKLAKLEN